MSINNRLISTGGVPVPGPDFYGVRYTGTGSTQDITGFGFTPDIVWVKGNIVTNPAMSSIINGFSSFLSWNTSGGLTSLTSTATPIADGVRITGSDASYNQSGVTYDIFAWKAGGNPKTNTKGTITSQTSANVGSGISVISWTGNDTNGATIGHGLSSAPELVIVKSTNSGTFWMMGGAAMGNNSYQSFNDYNGTIQTNNTSIFQTFDATTFSVGTDASVNSSSQNYIAWCFHSVDGFSKIGKYASNNVTGTVATTFAPKFFLGRSTTCGYPGYVKNKYMSTYFYQLYINSASVQGPGIDLRTNDFRYKTWFNDQLRCGDVVYATFGSDLM